MGLARTPSSAEKTNEPDDASKSMPCSTSVWKDADYADCASHGGHVGFLVNISLSSVVFVFRTITMLKKIGDKGWAALDVVGRQVCI